MKIKYSKLITDMSSELYHSTPDTVSSSQLKDLLDNPEEFHHKYVSKKAEKLHIDAFDVGSYFHTAVLEPHKLTEDIVIYPGKRFGSQWEAFKKKNRGKAICSPAMEKQAKKLVSAVKASKACRKWLKGGVSEASLFVRLVVADGRIYAKDHGLILGMNGWEKTKAVPKGTEITVKVRADRMNQEKGFIIDLKSTTGNAKSKSSMESKVKNYNYGLSAAFYMDIYNVIGLGIKTFVWIFASKDVGNAKPWKVGKNHILAGRAKWSEAIITLAENIENDWELDCTGTLDPDYEDMQFVDVMKKRLKQAK